jgi:hypothetical protein
MLHVDLMGRLKESRDPVGNIVSAENDFRVLAPRVLTDPMAMRLDDLQQQGQARSPV